MSITASVETTTESTGVAWAIHSGKTTRSAPIAQGITTWDYFVKHVCQSPDVLIVPKNVSWEEVKLHQSR